jgi:hypothetical protein
VWRNTFFRRGRRSGLLESVVAARADHGRSSRFTLSDASALAGSRR